MKEKLFNFTFALLSITSLTFIFYHNKEVAGIILAAIDLFIKKVFVSLFPMFILNDLFISLNLPFYFYKIFHFPFKILFKTSGISAYVFIMSLISGTPSQAYILSELVKSHKISVDEANHYLYFTYFSNPLFLVTMLSTLFPIFTTIKIISIHYFSNIIIAFLVRKKAPLMSNESPSTNTFRLGSTITSSIKKSMNTLLMILGTIVFYMLLSHIITSIVQSNILVKTTIKGALELTQGLQALEYLNLGKIKEILAISFISFGGLSIHTQIKGILEDTNISYHNFFIGRIYQTIISIILIIIF